jgi:hypothetical protein
MSRLGFTTLVAACISIALAGRAHALDGMVLLIDAGHFSRGDLMIRYLSDGEQKTLDNGSCFGPSFSPDGKKIAYSEGNRTIYIINIDGSGKTEVTSCGGNEVMLNWAGNGYLYWSQCDENIYRVKTDGSDKETVYTSSKNIHGVGVSQDGDKAAWTAPSWEVRGCDISSGSEKRFGGGCQGSISPNGRYVTHNLDGHREARIHNFGGGTYTTISSPEGSFNAHRWSHSENDYCLYSLEGSRKAYVHNIKNNTAHYIGANASIYDYYATEIHLGPSDPSISLSDNSIEFTAVEGETPTPGEIVIDVTNSSPGSTLETVSVSGAPSWLDVSVGGSGNSQTLTNTVDAANLPGNGTHTETITVSAGNASPGSTTYTVTLTVTAPAVQEPYSGSPIALPGTIQSEDFDNGGEGTSYHDGDGTNDGGDYRTDVGVDIEGCSDDGGGYDIGWTEAGEWTEYTVSIAAAGAYDIQLRAASPNTGGSAHIEIDGEDVTGAMSIPNTGNWQDYQTVSVSDVSLPEGTHVLRLYIDQGEFNHNWIAVVEANTTPPVVVTSPVEGETYQVGDDLTVTWNADCDQVPGVTVELSMNGGQSWSFIENSGNLDCGEQTWVWSIPETVYDNTNNEDVSTVSTQCLIRVANYMGSGEAFTGMFTIEENSQATHLARPAVPRGSGAELMVNGRRIVLPGTSSGPAGYYLISPSGRRLPLSAVGPEGIRTSSGTWIVVPPRGAAPEKLLTIPR